MKPPKSKMAELAHNAVNGEKSHAEAKCARAEGVGLPECEARAAKRSQEVARGRGIEFKQTELGPIPVDWVVKRIIDVAPLQRGFDLPFSHLMEGVVPVVYSNGIGAYHSKGMCKGPGLVTGRSGTNNPLFVKYLYETLDFEDFSTGTGVPTLNRNSVHEHKVVIPPLAEQQAIATVLSDIDELISALGKLIEKKRNIKTGAMQELLTGKTRLPGFKGKWVEKTFCEFISRFATGLNPRQNFKLNSGGNNYYITIKDFKNGKISFNGCDKVDDLALRLINERSDLRAGDLLFSSIGRVGDAYVIKDTPSNWNINESVFSLRPDESQMDVNFLYYLVKSSAVQERLTSGITGSTLTGIKIGELRGIVCFYPNELAEQKAIAAVLSDMDAEIAALEADRAKYERIKSGMMQELLTGKTRIGDFAARRKAQDATAGMGSDL